MDIRHLTQEELNTIYDQHIYRDFPSREVKPLSFVRTLLAQNQYKTFGLFDDDILVAYSFWGFKENSPYVMLDFLAVLPGIRGKGYGSYFLTHIKDTLADYQGLLLEVEDPEKALNADDLRIRQARISLYTRLGARVTGVRSRVDSVDFRILYMPLSAPADDQTVADALVSLYSALIEPRLFENDMSIAIDGAAE